MSIRHVYDTAANLDTADPVLGAGEFGIESDTGGRKIGDGSTAWTSLPYVDGSLFVGLGQFAIEGGTPAFGGISTLLRSTHIRFDPTTQETLVMTLADNIVAALRDWDAIDIYLWTCEPLSVAANNVVWLAGPVVFANGGTTSSTYLASVTTAINGAQYSHKRHFAGTVNIDAIAADAIPHWFVRRVAADAADTYAGDIGYVGCEIVRKYT